MLSRVTRSVLTLAARRPATAAPRFAQLQAATARFSTDESPAQQVLKDELALSPKVQTVLDQILDLNMIEIVELSTAIQVRHFCLSLGLHPPLSSPHPF